MVIKNTVPVIKQIEDAVKDIPGWSPVDQLFTLFNLVVTTSHLEGDIVEIGSWCGRSAVVLGMAARLIGDLHVHSVDLFPERENWKQNEDGNYSFKIKIGDKEYKGCHEQTVWKEPFEKDILPIYLNNHSILNIFLRAISKAELQDVVVPFRGDSSLFVESLNRDFKCRLAFIDSDHSYSSVCKDIGNVERYLVVGGWICFDDAFSHYEGIDKAIEDNIIKSDKYDLCQQMTRKLFIARKSS